MNVLRAWFISKVSGLVNVKCIIFKLKTLYEYFSSLRVPRLKQLLHFVNEHLNNELFVKA